MLLTCNVCNKIVQEGDRIVVEVTSTYHMLKSTVSYALDKHDMEADSRTIHHEECSLRDE